MLVITSWFWLAPLCFSFLCLNRNSQTRDNIWDDNITSVGFPNLTTQTMTHLSYHVPPPMLWLPGAPTTKTLLPSPGMSLCSGFSSAHIFWHNRAKGKEMISSSGLFWPSSTSKLQLPALESCTALNCLLTSPSKLRQMPKARDLGFGRESL